MRIVLNEFEQYIDETILKRGLQYFKKGYVEDVEEISPNQYEATVHGSETYTVTMDLENGVIVDTTCDCPYDYGAFCKHQVAVMFYLQKDNLALDIVDVKLPKANKIAKPKAKTEAQLLQEILQKLSQDDLLCFISEQCANNKTFRQQFIGRYIALVEGESKAMYDKQVKAVFRSFKDREGYISYRDAGRLNAAMQELIMQADKLLYEKRWNSAWMLSLSIFEEAVETLQYADDSNGDIGDLCEQPLVFIEEITRSAIDETLRLEIYNYCLSAFKKKTFDGLDFHWRIFGMAESLAKSELELQQLMLLLDQIKPEKGNWSSNYQYEEALQMKLQLIQRMQGEEKALEFESQHLNITVFREQAIKRAIFAKDFIKVILLCEEGIKQDEKDKPGLIHKWEDYLLAIYKETKQKEPILKIGLKRFKSNRGVSRADYDLLKKQIPAAEWSNYLANLLEEIRKTKQSGLLYNYADVFIWEQLWDKLLELLKAQPTIYNLDNWGSFLIDSYKDEIILLYQQVLLRDMEMQMGRGAYQNTCRYLRKLKKMGATDTVNEIVAKFRTLYPKRKALMEELDAL